MKKRLHSQKEIVPMQQASSPIPNVEISPYPHPVTVPVTDRLYHVIEEFSYVWLVNYSALKDRASHFLVTVSNFFLCLMASI